MNYQSVKLDKSMYKHEKGFLSCLEELDPSAGYQSGPLSGLDAFERQLSRFGIKVKGVGSSAIQKFFATADSAAPFPEYVSRAVAQGAKESGVIDAIVAARTNVSSLDYRSIVTDLDCGDISAPIAEGAAIPETNITLSESLVKLKKRGRVPNASYEAIKFQRIDVFSVALGQIGSYIAKAHLKDAVATLLTGSPEQLAPAGAKVAYGDLLSLWGLFEDFELNTLLAATDMAVDILSIGELKDPVMGLGFQKTGAMVTPLGARLVRSSAVPAGTVIALDKRFALEMVSAGGVQVEHDKLINAQLERAAVTSICGFNKLFGGAVKVLKK